MGSGNITIQGGASNIYVLDITEAIRNGEQEGIPLAPFSTEEYNKLSAADVVVLYSSINDAYIVADVKKTEDGIILMAEDYNHDRLFWVSVAELYVMAVYTNGFITLSTPSRISFDNLLDENFNPVSAVNDDGSLICGTYFLPLENLDREYDLFKDSKKEITVNFEDEAMSVTFVPVISVSADYGLMHMDMLYLNIKNEGYVVSMAYAPDVWDTLLYIDITNETPVQNLVIDLSDLTDSDGNKANVSAWGKFRFKEGEYSLKGNYRSSFRSAKTISIKTNAGFVCSVDSFLYNDEEKLLLVATTTNELAFALSGNDDDGTELWYVAIGSVLFPNNLFFINLYDNTTDTWITVFDETYFYSNMLKLYHGNVGGSIFDYPVFFDGSAFIQPEAMYTVDNRDVFIVNVVTNDGTPKKYGISFIDQGVPVEVEWDEL